MDFSLAHPPIQPLYIRHFRLFGRRFVLAYLYEWRPFIPVQNLADALEIEADVLLDQFDRNEYLQLYWANTLIPDDQGTSHETRCLDITMLPLLVIAHNLTRKPDGKENELLDAICNESVLALAEHFHLGSRDEIRKARISLDQDVADLLSSQK